MLILKLSGGKRDRSRESVEEDNTKNVDDAQLDWLINEVRQLTSEESRICERYEEFGLIE